MVAKGLVLPEKMQIQQIKISENSLELVNSSRNQRKPILMQTILKIDTSNSDLKAMKLKSVENSTFF